MSLALSVGSRLLQWAVLGCAVSGTALASVPLHQISATVYQTEHCLFIIDTTVTWSSPTTAYSEIYLPSGGTFPRLSGYFDTLTAAFPASYFSICYIANTGASNVPNYIDQIFKATGIQEPGTAGAAQSFSTVDFCRYNLSGGNVFTPALGVFDHELGHAWGAHIFHTLAPPWLSNGHWLANSTVDCQLSATYSDDSSLTVNKIYGDPSSGFRWQRVDNLRSNDISTFSEQELYAMGVSATFPTAYVLNTPVYNADHTMSYSSVDTFDHTAVVALHGVRNPDYQTSAKQFRLGFVYIARDLAEVTAVYQPIEQSIDHFCNAEAIDSAGYRFQTPFLADTHFRASVVGRLADLDGNATPTLTVTNTYVTSVDGSATVAFSASDVGGATPTVSIVPSSTHCSVSGSSVSITGLPDGVHFFTLKAVDAGGKKAFGHFVVEVQRPASSTSVSTQPSSQTVVSGASASFTIVASGTPATFTYRWMREAAGSSTWDDLNDGGAYSGSATSTLSVSSSTTMNGDRFLCLVNNSVGAATSQSATLIVNESVPSLTTQPIDHMIAAGSAVHFSVVVAGAPTSFGYSHYQWQRVLSGSSTWSNLSDGGGVSGSATASLTVSGTTIAMSGDQFRCAVSNTAGATTSTIATLTVNVIPSITTHPQSVSSPAGQDVAFTVTATGTAPLAYQWYKYGAAIAGGTSATLTLTAVQATDAGAYTVVVSNAVGSATSNVGSLAVSSSAPSITTHPQSVSTTAGQSVSFSVVAVGTAPLTYQWRKDGVAISGATSISLTLSNVQSSSAGDYSVVVSNSAGSAISGAATLTISALATAPSISSQPQSMSATAGQTASFTAVAAGTAPFTYQWKKNGVTISGATTATLSLASIQTTDAADYTVVVTNSVGTVTSAAATLTVAALANAPTILTQPASLTVTAGQSASFSASAGGSGPFTYQWRKDAAAIAGAISSTLSLTGVQSADAGDYTLSVSNSVGSVTSAAATLTVLAAQIAPIILVQPSSVTVAQGATTTLSVTATGTGTLYYQWSLNGNPLGGATSSSFTLSGIQAVNAGNYSVTVSNSAGSTQSAAATVTLSITDFSGFYSGSFGAAHDGGEFALLAGHDGSNTLVAKLTGVGLAIVANNFPITADGSFSFGAAGTTTAADPRVFAGVVSGQLTAGGLSLAVPALGLSATTVRLSGGTSTANYSGFHSGLPIGQSSGEIYVVVGDNGQTFLLELGAAAIRTGTGTMSDTGALQLTVGAGTASALTYAVSFGTGAFQATANGPAGVVLFLSPPALSGHQRLINIASRGFAGADDKTLIAGFVISGPEAKDVLIRAVGPTLVGLGVSGVLADPKLKLFRGSTAILENDNWETNGSGIAAVANQLGAFALNTGSRDAALLTHLSPGVYSAQVITSNGATGVTLIEIYDAGTTERTAPKVVNLSTRAEVGRGDDILIAGFVVTGDAPKKILIRAIGPSLTALGVNGALADPFLKVYKGSAPFAQNDNWSDGSDAWLIAITASTVGAFALTAGSKDAGLLLYLEPGVYSAQVSGVGNTTGIAMVEVYEVTD